MYDLFYIIEVSPQWYNLIVRDTHYCVACGGDLDQLKRTIYSYVRKYKVKDRVYRVLSGLESGGTVSPATFGRRAQLYDSGAHFTFEDLVRGVVSEALKENRQDTPYHHAKKRAVVLVPKKIAASPMPPSQEVRTIGKVTPRKIKRTTTE